MMLPERTHISLSWTSLYLLPVYVIYSHKFTFPFFLTSLNGIESNKIVLRYPSRKLNHVFYNTLDSTFIVTRVLVVIAFKKWSINRIRTCSLDMCSRWWWSSDTLGTQLLRLCGLHHWLTSRLNTTGCGSRQTKRGGWSDSWGGWSSSRGGGKSGHRRLLSIAIKCIATSDFLHSPLKVLLKWWDNLIRSWNQHHWALELQTIIK